MENRPTVVVTGANTGIGFAICQTLLSAGYQVCGSVRSTQAAQEAQAALGVHFHPLLFDVTDNAAIQNATQVVAELLGGRRLAALINNAGIAVGGPLPHLPIVQLQHQLDVNVVGVVRVTQAFLPMLGMDAARSGPPGRIINISSVSGELGFPFVGAYVASKHALEGLSKSLRIELMPFRIPVVVLGPGSVRTPIWQKSHQEDYSIYANTYYAAALANMRARVLANDQTGMPAEQVGRLVLRILQLHIPKARYAIAGNLLTDWLIPRWMPTKILARIVAKMLGLLPQ